MSLNAILSNCFFGIGLTVHAAPEAPEAAKPEKATTPRKKKASPTKPAQPKPKKTANKAASKKADAKSASSDSDSDSSDDSESDIEVQEEPSPLPPTRPDNPEGAAEYDALKAVWAPRNRRPNVEKIKSALVAFKDVVKSVRDEWKTQSQAMKEAENKSENDKAAELKKKVVLQRHVMDVVVRTTLEKGHPVIVEKYVLFLFDSLTFLADHRRRRRHGCRSLKRIENYYHVTLLAWITSAFKELFTTRKGTLSSITPMAYTSQVYILGVGGLRTFAGKHVRLAGVDRHWLVSARSFLASPIQTSLRCMT